MLLFARLVVVVSVAVVATSASSWSSSLVDDEHEAQLFASADDASLFEYAEKSALIDHAAFSRSFSAARFGRAARPSTSASTAAMLLSRVGGGTGSNEYPCGEATANARLGDSALTSQCSRMFTAVHATFSSGFAGASAAQMFGKTLERAHFEKCCACVARAESSLRLNAHNYNSKGDLVLGLFQTTSDFWPDASRPPCTFDAQVDAAINAIKSTPGNRWFAFRKRSEERGRSATIADFVALWAKVGPSTTYEQDSFDTKAHNANGAQTWWDDGVNSLWFKFQVARQAHKCRSVCMPANNVNYQASSNAAGGNNVEREQQQQQQQQFNNQHNNQQQHSSHNGGWEPLDEHYYSPAQQTNAVTASQLSVRLAEWRAQGILAAANYDYASAIHRASAYARRSTTTRADLVTATLASFWSAAWTGGVELQRFVNEPNCCTLKQLCTAMGGHSVDPRTNGEIGRPALLFDERTGAMSASVVTVRTTTGKQLAFDPFAEHTVPVACAVEFRANERNPCAQACH